MRWVKQDTKSRSQHQWLQFTTNMALRSSMDGRVQNGPRLWRMFLLPDKATVQIPTSIPPPMHTSLQAFSAYDMTSVEELVHYFHVSSGFPVWDTWIKAIQAGNFKSWPGLTLKNATKYCPMSKETIKGHMVQKHQNVWSKNANTQTRSPYARPNQCQYQHPMSSIFG